jgi:hypothetical protein
MPDKKISEFETFKGIQGDDVYYIVASGDSNNPNAKNFKVAFTGLASDITKRNSEGGAAAGGESRLPTESDILYIGPNRISGSGDTLYFGE